MPLIAYPYGQVGDFDEKCVNLAKTAGYRAACGSCFGRFNMSEDLYALKRVDIWEDDALNDLKLKLSGFYDWMALKENLAWSIKRHVSTFLVA